MQPIIKIENLSKMYRREMWGCVAERMIRVIDLGSGKPMLVIDDRRKLAGEKTRPGDLDMKGFNVTKDKAADQALSEAGKLTGQDIPAAVRKLFP